MSKQLDATVKSTGEKLTVYKLQNGNYYDFEAMWHNEPPSAPKSGKKEFSPSELTIDK